MSRLSFLVLPVLVLMAGCAHIRYSVAVDHMEGDGPLQTKYRYRIVGGSKEAEYRKLQPGVFAADGIPVRIYHHCTDPERSGEWTEWVCLGSICIFPRIITEEWSDVYRVGIGDQLGSVEVPVKMSTAVAAIPTSWMVPLGDPACLNSAHVYAREFTGKNDGDKVQGEFRWRGIDEARAYACAAILVQMEREGRINEAVVKRAYEKYARYQKILKAETRFGETNEIPVLVKELTFNSQLTTGTIAVVVSGINPNRAHREVAERVRLSALQEAGKRGFTRTIANIQFSNETWNRNEMAAQFVITWN